MPDSRAVKNRMMDYQKEVNKMTGGLRKKRIKKGKKK